MGLKDELRRLKRDVHRDAVLIRLRDGSTRTFPVMDVQAELYLLVYNRALGQPPRESPFMDALANATEESRREVMARAERYKDLLTVEEGSSDEPLEDLSE